ncbi:DUF226 domain-containing protein [Borreliella garinii]|uniref:Uncharacterized protein n=2 Tax=Borreliella garinii TaxID=29519 RepID=B8F1W5_BORGR|nr:DUF226 domain-containing protein [Borreliella garinii]ACL34902.1 conserved hypothetical protein [Borreliella garinii PBr]
MRIVKRKSSRKAKTVIKVITRKQIVLKEQVFFKKEIVGNKTLYHTKLMNVLLDFKVNRHAGKLLILVGSSIGKYRKWFNLFSSLKDGDEFLGIFYGFRSNAKSDVIFRDYPSICNFSKEIFATFFKLYYIEFRFRMGSVFCYIHSIAYLLQDKSNYNEFCNQFYSKLKDLEYAVYKFYDREMENFEGPFAMWWSLQRGKILKN